MRTSLKLSLLPLVALFLFLATDANAQSWTAKLDTTVRFYQTTELGVLLVGTEKSLYAIDGATGEALWRRKDVSLDETDVAPVPHSDLLLLSFEKGERTRVEAVDILTGDTIWKSDKIRGGVMQMAVEPSTNLLAVVFAKDAKGHAGDGFKRHPLLHVLDLATGDELWKNELSEVEMMPARWADGDVDFTLDNYHPPAFLDGRLYVFYEGLTSFDARTGKSRLRERYRVNEDGLALTEAAPIFDETLIYTSGHGRVRAISRETGDTEWEAKDLGLTPEMILVDQVLYVRTGGQFTRLKDGENVERGSYGVSAIDTRNGKVRWRYKGADKGITNLVLPNSSSIVVADRDDLIVIDSQTGKRRTRVRHGIERALFGVLNESGEVVVGGQSEIAAFDASSGREIWRARHTPPGRGIFRTVAAITARAASLYFRYGGTATTAFRGVQVARAAGGLSWSGLAARSSVSNLQALATNSARNYARAYAADRFRQFGIVSRVRDRLSAGTPAAPTPGDFVRRRTTNLGDVDERLLDRLDPAHQLERLSRFLWHRDRLAALRGNWMYFYTDLKGRDGNGLAGVNIHTGETEREIRLRDLDERFITDEALGLMFVSTGNRMVAYSVASDAR
ncbi:MAG TPA: PQQ-binding-like beta-propeller repeat protein [Pyrinomonadaceae bacterium]|jgi:outer membrane protein assembly factor BamB|nr:PQQ-binding-like beta-propeller repeat protein [Pyrinomonadaceae bacterium]